MERPPSNGTLAGTYKSTIPQIIIMSTNAAKNSKISTPKQPPTECQPNSSSAIASLETERHEQMESDSPKSRRSALRRHFREQASPSLSCCHLPRPRRREDFSRSHQRRRKVNPEAPICEASRKRSRTKGTVTDCRPVVRSQAVVLHGHR